MCVYCVCTVCVLCVYCVCTVCVLCVYCVCTVCVLCVLLTLCCVCVQLYHAATPPPESLINPASALPYGFVNPPTQTSFPVFFDRRLSRAQANSISNYLLLAPYTDAQTQSLHATFVTYSKDLELVGKVTVTATRDQSSSRFKIESRVDLLDAVVYSSHADLLRAALEIVYLASLFSLIIREVFELKDHWHRFGNVAGLIIYATNFGNMLDVANYTVQLISNFSWLSFSTLTHNWSPALSYDVLHDLQAANNYLRPGNSLNAGLSMFADVTSLNNKREVHLTTACVSLVLCSTQLIKNLDFHPRMGLISRTIGKAASAMTFFFLLFFSVVVIYAFLGHIQYGNSMQSFATLSEATQTLLVMLLGEFGNTQEAMIEVSTGITALYFWTFFLICFFILMNAFLAIIVEAYEAAKSDFDAFSYTDAITVLARRVYNFRNKKRNRFYVDNQTLEEVLDWTCDVWDEDEKEEKKPPEFLASARFDGVSLDDVPRSGRAVVLRVEEGDTVEDGTVDDKGQRVFFSEEHLRTAMTTNTINRIENEVLAKIIAHNVVDRFGHVVDINDDGEITSDEIRELCANGRHNGGSLSAMTMSLAKRAESAAQESLEVGNSVRRQSLELTSSVGKQASQASLANMKRLSFDSTPTS